MPEETNIEEIWKPIAVEGLERYEVSTWGRVRNIKGKILLLESKSGIKLYLEKKQTTFSIPELVAKIFIPNPNGYSDVNLLDEKSGSNTVDNLQWGLHYSPRTFILDGEEVTELSIHRYSVLIDPEDYNRVRQYTWSVFPSAKEREKGKGPYFHRRINHEEKEIRQPLQNFLIGLDCYTLSGKKVDHKLGNTLDNRKKNLRITDDTNRENEISKKKPRNNTSGFKGVCWAKYSKLNPWRAGIRVSRKKINLGCYPTPELAHKAYREAAVKYFGEYARFE